MFRWQWRPTMFWVIHVMTHDSWRFFVQMFLFGCVGIFQICRRNGSSFLKSCMALCLASYSEWPCSWMGNGYKTRVLCSGKFQLSTNKTCFLYLFIISSYYRFWWIYLLFIQGDRSKKVGIVDREYVVHQGIQSLGGPSAKKVSS